VLPLWVCDVELSHPSPEHLVLVSMLLVNVLVVLVEQSDSVHSGRDVLVGLVLVVQDPQLGPVVSLLELVMWCGASSPASPGPLVPLELVM
jgi:hypothetical protein